MLDGFHWQYKENAMQSVNNVATDAGLAEIISSIVNYEFQTYRCCAVTLVLALILIT